MQTATRYLRASENISVLNLNGLFDTIKGHMVSGHGDTFGNTCKSQPFVNDYTAKECVEAIDSLPSGEDCCNYVYMKRQDMMCRQSFIWDLREGDVPITGSSSTLAHTETSLAFGRDYYQQFVKQGDCSEIVSSGWANYYYSNAKCIDTFNLLGQHLGNDWKAQAKRQDWLQGIPQSLVVVFKNRKTQTVKFSFTLVGQGQVRKLPIFLRDFESGFNFMDVVDTHHNNVIRMGYDNGYVIKQYAEYA